MLALSDYWKEKYPTAHIGILTMHNVANPTTCTALDAKKEELEIQLRQEFADLGKAGIRALPVMQAYRAYYKIFKKSYHVQQQVESIVFKGRSIPRIAALVEAMYMAELKYMLLTAGHDLDVVNPPVKVDVAHGTESYTRINGQEQTLKADDMYIADSKGVMSAIIYGPDNRTKISPTTRSVLYTIYAPAGVPNSHIEQHLLELQKNVLLITPTASTTELKVYGST
jgi:DNA/RNA-binding domain of Phe-tRNA-synthetase-like protein